MTDTPNGEKPKTYADFLAQADKRHKEQYGKPLPLPYGLRLVQSNGKPRIVNIIGGKAKTDDDK